MSFTFNPNIPDANNYPGDDQPIMKNNNTATSNWVAIDHIGFNTPNDEGGKHKQVTFIDTASPVAPTGDQSVIYPSDGTASTRPELIFQNVNASFQLSAVKVYCAFTRVAASGAVVPLVQYNVASITATIGGSESYDIVFTTGSVNALNPGDVNYAVFYSTNNGTSFNYSKASTSITFSKTNTGGQAGNTISVLILQI